MSSFTRKRIDVTFILANNPETPERSVFRGDQNTLKLSGLRVSAEIRKVGAVGQGTLATIRIYGMLQSDMNRLSILTWGSQTVQLNKLIVSAGDDVMGMYDVFGGQIINAWADYSAAPEVALVVQANPAFFRQIAPAESNSYPNLVDAAQVFKDLAAKMAYTFENNGVSQLISSPYLAGSLMMQAQTLAKQIDCMLIVDGNLMTISPIGTPLKGEVPLISARSGMVGYPAFHQGGISVNSLFNPAVRFGGMIKVESEIDITNGDWVVTALNYSLESEKVGGAWFCQIEARRFGDAIGK